MTLDDTLIADRIGEAIGSQQAIAGWSDVKARAQRPERTRRVPRLGRTLLIAALFVLVGGSIAFAFGDRIGEVLGLQTPPPTIERQMRIDAGAFPTPVPGLPLARALAWPGTLVPGSSRLLISRSTTHFGRVRLFAGRTTRGYCELIVRDGNGTGECRSDLVRSSSPVVFGYSASASAPGWRLVDGRAYAPNARVLRLRFRAGSSRTIALVDRFFLFELPPGHARGSSDPLIAFDVLDASGRSIGTRLHPYSFGTARPDAGSVRLVERVRLANAQGTAAIWSGRDTDGDRCIGARANSPSAPTSGWTCSPSVLRYGFRVDVHNPAVVHRVATSWTFGRSGQDSSTYAYGWVSPAVARLRLRFQDGAAVDIPLHQGYFLYAIPTSRWRAGRRPSVLVALGRTGRPIDDRFLYPREACVYPGDARACGPSGGIGGTVVADDNGGYAGTTSSP